jgi:hypothetical protein
MRFSTSIAMILVLACHGYAAGTTPAPTKATAAESLAGVNDTKFVTPLGLKRAITNQVPALVGTAATNAALAVAAQAATNAVGAAVGPAATNAAAALVPALIARQTNTAQIGVLTNAALDFYPARTTFRSSARVPQVYAQSGFGDTLLENNIRGMMTNLAKNYLPVGVNTLQLDAGWGFRSNGVIVSHPDRFPTPINDLVAFAHSLGLKVLIFCPLQTNDYSAQPGSGAYIESDARYFVTNVLVDGFKFDLDSYSTTTDQLLGVQRFVSTALKAANTRPLYFGASPPSVLTAQSAPYLAGALNRYYVAYAGAADPFAPYGWTNIINHWHAVADHLAFIEPGHTVESVGWSFYGGDIQASRCMMNLAAIACSDVMITSDIGVDSPLARNRTYLDILRNNHVTAPVIIATNLMENVTNTAWMRYLDSDTSTKRAVCFINESTNLGTPASWTITATNLQFSTNVWTVLSSTNESVIAFATNTWTFTLSATNTALFRVQAGVVYPSDDLSGVGVTYSNGVRRTGGGTTWLFMSPTNIDHATNITGSVTTEATNTVFAAMTFGPGLYEVEAYLDVQTRGSTAGGNANIACPAEARLLGTFIRNNGLFTQPYQYDLPRSGGGIYICTANVDPTLTGQGYTSGLLIVNSFTRFTLQLEERTAVDAVNRPYLTTNSFVKFKKL